MSYADDLLSAGERVMHREKQHWFVFVWGARYTILAVIVGIVLAVFGNTLTSPVRDILNIVAIVLFDGGVALLTWTTLRYLKQEYVLTNRRVIQVEGVVNKRAIDSSLEKINDAVLTQSIFGRMFGFGDLEVLTASESGISKFRMLVNPIGFKKAMLDAKHEYELDVSGAYAGGPPLRTEPAPMPSAPPPSPPVAPLPVAATPAPAAPPRPAGPDDTVSTTIPRPTAQLTSDEVTRTLANLADLRDRGAISADEYEHKKDDLLSRL
jgi:hypothetical protein